MSKDWMPGKRWDILTMAKIWIQVLGENREAWEIPARVVVELRELAISVESAINANNSTARGPVTAAMVNEAIGRLKHYMRSIKNRYFFVPPLTVPDLIRLHLHPADTTLTNVGVPTDPAECDLAFPAAHIVEVVNIRPNSVTHGDPRSRFGVRIHYGILAPEGSVPALMMGKPFITAVPKMGDDLSHSVFTRRRRHLFDFSGFSGMRVFVCLRYENSKGKTGPFGQMRTAFIP